MKSFYVFLIALFLSFLSFNAPEAYQIAPDDLKIQLHCKLDEIKQGGKFSVSVLFENLTSCHFALKSFEIKTVFDFDALELKEIKGVHKSLKNNFKFDKTDDGLNLSFDFARAKLVLPASSREHIFELEFTAKSNFDLEETHVFSSFETLNGREFLTDAEPIKIKISEGEFPRNKDKTKTTPKKPDGETKQSKKDPNLKLEALAPSAGKLLPEFSTEIYEYCLNVPAETKDIYFEASPDSAKVNRHKLLSAGNTTDVKISLGKEEYVVHVNRAEKVGSASGSSHKKKSKKGKIAPEKRELFEKTENIEEPAQEEYSDSEEKSKSGPRFKILIILGSSVFVILAGAGVYYFLKIRKKRKITKKTYF